jgi:hypothetical protein
MFFLIADILGKGADGIFRGQSQRHYDFRKGERLGKNDHKVDWGKPSKPEWMDQKTYESYPEEIEVREFKAEGKVYVTTFLNDKGYHKKELARIYELRWQVEITLKNIKSTMNMDMLSCKTPEMVIKEIGIHFLAYNFIRVIMAEACSKHDAKPNQISFKGTVQLVNEMMAHFINTGRSRNKKIYDNLLKQIVKNRIGNRAGRIEPRVVKRRRKPFPALNKPRIVEKARLIKKMKKMILRNSCA